MPDQASNSTGPTNSPAASTQPSSPETAHKHEPSHSETTTSPATPSQDGGPPESSSRRRSSDPAVPDRDGSSSSSNGDDELPSQSESRRDRISAAFQTFMDNAQRAATEASNWASNATGTSYRAIDRLKTQNQRLEDRLARSRAALERTRRDYQSVVQRRLQTQREVNTLLARKDAWTPADLERFTTLYRDDHTLDSAVAAAAAALAAAERDTEQLRERLVAGILGRYHEEQIWSDRIRRLSTWGTWGLMGVNVLLFLLFQFGAEPWRRARLTRGFEEKVAEGVKRVLDEERARASSSAASPAPAPGPGQAIVAVVPPEAAASAGPATIVPGAGTTTTTTTTREYEQEATQSAEVGDPSPPPTPAILGPADATTPATTPTPPSSSPKHPRRLATARIAAAAAAQALLLLPGRWKAAFLDLFSDRVVRLRMRDVSLMVAEGAVAGAGAVVAAAAVASWLVGR